MSFGTCVGWLLLNMRICKIKFNLNFAWFQGVQLVVVKQILLKSVNCRLKIEKSWNVNKEKEIL